MNILVEPGKRFDVLQRFVMELLDGQKDPVVAQYYGAFASVGANTLVSYPLCYVREIFTQLRCCEAVDLLLNILSHLDAHQTCTVSDLAWKSIVKVARCWRCSGSVRRAPSC
mmetsp:Transcript_26211/g.36057  ORF Transcript_26211/g.36057 Transcript_26211/m.36057 type:complete len:112 (-) Transcript_26211:370-705(-)